MATELDPGDHWPEDNSEEENNAPVEGSTVFSQWGWPLFAVAAFAIFELTTSLMWTALVLALKFGWRDTYSGWYFWRRDSSISRGLALALMFLTSATSKVFVADFVMLMMVIPIILPQGPQMAPQLNDTLLAMSMLFCGGMLASGLLCLMAVIVCLWSGHRVWVDRESYKHVIQGIWPPFSYTTNRCNPICFFAMIPLTGLFLILTLVLPMRVLLDPLNQNQPAWSMLLIIVPAICSVPFFMWGQAWTAKSVRANHPWECWPEMIGLSGPEELNTSHIHWTSNDELE